ncbi:MAG: proline--tRNA ligase [Chloroflexota bacterium]|nr:proline--tRNA ligase [Chloroflexota bacterium]
MRRTQLFCETLRQSPNDSEVAGHSLLLRGGFVQPLSAGIFSLLPLGQRVRAKLEKILREEMDAIDGQEVSLPVVHPAELWQETGRWYDVGPELARFRDRAGRDMVLAMTHEEVVADLLRKHVRSYRQLPIMLYQIQTKFRDEPRARGGLLRVREFVMKDAYSCHATFDDLDAYYPRVCQAYLNIFGRAGLDVMTVEADVGMMGGTMAHEFMFVSEVGEDQLVLCDACGYAANRQIATFQKEVSDEDDVLPLEEVPTPEAKTIAALAALLEIPERRTAKAAFFMSGDQLIFAVVRGDMEVNETKLANAVGAAELRAARADELESRGIVAGYASPIGISGATVIVDDAVASSRNLVAGANREGYHLRHTNFGRDYNADRVIDIAAAREGAGCIECGSPLRLVRGVEVGNTFKLGMKYSKALEATFLDDTGREQYIVMGCYGIGVGRLMACIAERHHDRDGLIWPPSVAPFQIYLVGLDGEDDTVRAATEDLYAMLQGAGFETLYDDRHERAGVKFKDADLLGMPVRLTVSRRTEESGQVELKQRASGETRKVARDEVLDEIRAELEWLIQAN